MDLDVVLVLALEGEVVVASPVGNHPVLDPLMVVVNEGKALRKRLWTHSKAHSSWCKCTWRYRLIVKTVKISLVLAGGVV
jgi:hypothetical protein